MDLVSWTSGLDNLIVSGEKSGVNDHVDENPEEINNEQWITSAMKWDNNDDGLVFINVGQLENIQLEIIVKYLMK